MTEFESEEKILLHSADLFENYVGRGLELGNFNEEEVFGLERLAEIAKEFAYAPDHWRIIWGGYEHYKSVHPFELSLEQDGTVPAEIPDATHVLYYFRLARELEITSIYPPSPELPREELLFVYMHPPYWREGERIINYEEIVAASIESITTALETYEGPETLNIRREQLESTLDFLQNRLVVRKAIVARHLSSYEIKNDTYHFSTRHGLEFSYTIGGLSVHLLEFDNFGKAKRVLELERTTIRDEEWEEISGKLDAIDYIPFKASLISREPNKFGRQLQRMEKIDKNPIIQTWAHILFKN